MVVVAVFVNQRLGRGTGLSKACDGLKFSRTLMAFR